MEEKDANPERSVGTCEKPNAARSGRSEAGRFSCGSKPCSPIVHRVRRNGELAGNGEESQHPSSSWRRGGEPAAAMAALLLPPQQRGVALEEAKFARLKVEHDAKEQR